LDEEKLDWFNEFTTALHTHKVRQVRNDVVIMNLPECYRVPVAQYTPKKWRFGLHNRDVLHPSKSEEYKIALAAACELEPWDDFCASVVDDPLTLLQAYGLNDETRLFSKKQVACLLTLDALTIFFVFAYYASDVFRVANMEKGFELIFRLMSSGYAHVPIDLFLFENQIPIFLLKKVITECYQKWGAQHSAGKFEAIVRANVSKMCGYIFELTDDDRAKTLAAYPPGELERCPHILAFIYKILCGNNLKRKSGDRTITMRSATSLKKAGIQIKGIEGVLDKVDFRKRCLFLPIVKLYDQTESYFRNLAMYEFMKKYNSSELPFGEYLQLMTSLMKEVGDAKHLIDCGVIQNKLGSDNNAFQMWDSLQSELFLPNYSIAYGDMVSKINDQCRSSRKVLGTEFCQLFCSRPWSALGVFTAIFITVATGIQAYTSVIGSHKMRPHYPP
jgi:hypothetical protein